MTDRTPHPDPQDEIVRTTILDTIWNYHGAEPGEDWSVLADEIVAGLAALPADPPRVPAESEWLLLEDLIARRDAQIARLTAALRAVRFTVVVFVESEPLRKRFLYAIDAALAGGVPAPAEDAGPIHEACGRPVLRNGAVCLDGDDVPYCPSCGVPVETPDQ